MTDAEIVAYNAGVAAYDGLGPFWPGSAAVAERVCTLAGDRERGARDRLGDEAFFGWADKGAWDAAQRAAR